MTIQIEIRNVYGNEAIYPANDAARHFAAIAGTKTLKRDTIRHAKALGFQVEIVSNRAEAVAFAELVA